MRLWTWQKEGFDIGDESTPVKSFKHSDYLNNAFIPERERKHFKRQYAKLFKRLETSQFHWYFTEEDEAKSKDSQDEFRKRGRELWEVAVPDEKVFRRICNKAWKYLLYKPTDPSRLTDDDQKLMNTPQVEERERRERSFRAFWEKMKSESELWDVLFLEETVEGCTSVLLCHPLENSWIKRNPIKKDKWWETEKKKRDGPSLYDCPLPCKECPGRR